ncbi:hypothetical protein PUN28_011852 [Cardiocondyla obscurior]|uniref:Uncharacterized protein n=1 Tax=Cardiocondyla obscurior TaxID=286306 RepID=A0AAW2FJ77_9HYME
MDSCQSRINGSKASMLQCYRCLQVRHTQQHWKNILQFDKHNMLLTLALLRKHSPRIKNYVDRVVNNYVEDDFKSYFRLVNKHMLFTLFYNIFYIIHLKKYHFGLLEILVEQLDKDLKKTVDFQILLWLLMVPTYELMHRKKILAIM